eukprot:6670353-Ditylum_brightwellii.AAC.1
MLHGLHSVYPPPDVTQHPGSNFCAEKRLKQGDGQWDFKKEILGLIETLLTSTAAPLKCYQKLTGKLQHTSYGISGGAGLFSPLQMVMAGDPDYVCITPFLRKALRDWIVLVHHLKHTPTSVLQLVKDYLHFIGHTDAGHLGAGGVWTARTKHLAPAVW